MVLELMDNIEDRYKALEFFINIIVYQGDLKIYISKNNNYQSIIPQLLIK